MAIYFDKTTIKTGASGIPVIYEGENLDEVLEVQNTTITAQDDIIAQIQASVVDKCLKPEQTKTATPSLSQQTISPDSGKVLSGVTVEPITSTLLTSLDSDFKAENIAEGVNMFGLVGTMAGASVEFGWFTYYSTYVRLPFVIGMTWGEWIASYLNVNIPDGSGFADVYADGDYVAFHTGVGGSYYISTDGTQANRVTLSDLIINEFAYSRWASSSGGGDFED